jgi:hypothetical protein
MERHIRWAVFSSLKLLNFAIFYQFRIKLSSEFSGGDWRESSNCLKSDNRGRFCKRMELEHRKLIVQGMQNRLDSVSKIADVGFLSFFDNRAMSAWR